MAMMMFFFTVDLVVERKKKPSTGMSPSMGTFFTVSLARSVIRPPITTVC
jgi:hypothetical protein